jgi:hypothetical protein
MHNCYSVDFLFLETLFDMVDCLLYIIFHYDAENTITYYILLVLYITVMFVLNMGCFAAHLGLPEGQ